jgi:hypothetical protein
MSCLLFVVPRSLRRWFTVLHCLPTSFSLPGSSFGFTPTNHGEYYATPHPGLFASCRVTPFASCRPSLMCCLRRRRCRTSFVTCGICLSVTTRGCRRRMVQVFSRQVLPEISSNIFTRATSRYMNAKTLLPMMTTPPFHSPAPRITYALFRITAMRRPRLYFQSPRFPQTHLPLVHPLQSHPIQFLRILPRAQRKVPRTSPLQPNTLILLQPTRHRRHRLLHGPLIPHPNYIRCTIKPRSHRNAFHRPPLSFCNLQMFP